MALISGVIRSAHEGVDHAGEGGTDDHGHGQVEQVPPQQELLELLHHGRVLLARRSSVLAPSTRSTRSARRRHRELRADRRGPRPASDRWSARCTPRRPGVEQPVHHRPVVGVRRDRCHQAPPWMVLGDPPAVGQGSPRSRQLARPRWGPAACWRPTVVGLAGPSGCGRPGIQVTVGTWWVDPPRKANGPGGGGSCSSSMIGSTLIQPVPSPPDAAMCAEELGVVVGHELELERSAPGHVWRSRTPSGQRVRARPRHESGSPPAGRTTNLEKPTARNCSSMRPQPVDPHRAPPVRGRRPRRRDPSARADAAATSGRVRRPMDTPKCSGS